MASRSLPVTPPRPLPGRGVAHRPPNRFERLQVERDEWTDADDPAPRTQFLQDATRTIIARNDSPDVGFDVSVNPYRGCEHGCVYCLAPDTPILHADLVWRPIGQVRAGDALVGFDEYPEAGRTRKLRKSVVEKVWWSSAPTLRIVTEREELVTTPEHRWLQWRNFRWSRTDALRPGSLLRHVPRAEVRSASREYRHGYIAGMTEGDGTFRFEPNGRSDKLGFPSAYWRVALADREPLDRLVEYLATFRVDCAVRPFAPGSIRRRRIEKVETRSLGKLARLHALIHREGDSAEYRRGFLAGFFDAEGNHGGSLRISQKNQATLRRVQEYARAIGFTFKLEPRLAGASSIRLVGGHAERMRFLAETQPAIRRKTDPLFGRQPGWTPEPVLAVERGATRDVVDIQTSTGTFFAAGLAAHNCYARPNHEYLGYSAGLDFETKILVKERAPELLRKALASPRWKPQPLGMSGVTDAYQPVERRLRITRRCLEVLAEFRNPVTIVTKNHLVTRDVDLLAELASYDAVRVTLSVTTLRNEVQRVMEPRTSVPARRLRAIATLARAGVPVSVNVAPVVPGLTDYEMPAILEAAASAGATSAAYIMLKLPYAVKDMFEVWLDQHFPDRAGKILNRLYSLRGGKLYDGRFGVRQRGEGPFAEQVASMFRVTCARLGLNGVEVRPLSTAAFRRPAPGGQGDLFGG